MNRKNSAELVVEVLQTLWPEGVRPLDYRNLLRVIRIVEEAARESAKVEDSLSSAQNGFGPAEQRGG